MMTLKSVRPWNANEECPEPGYAEFKQELLHASYYNAAEGSGEWSKSRECVRAAAEIAIDKQWPYWVIERMFKEIRPLVDWSSFMQSYINLLYAGYHK